MGPVATSTKDPGAIWYGVEWDDTTRGKHDGSVEKDGVVRYFTCVEGAGSFVKPKKVDRGSSLVDALRKKYVELDAAIEAHLEVEKNAADSREFLQIKDVTTPFPPKLILTLHTEVPEEESKAVLERGYPNALGHIGWAAQRCHPLLA